MTTIGHGGACRVMDTLETVGIIGASAQSGQARPVLTNQTGQSDD